MQNIDSTYFALYLAMIGFSAAILLYWRFERTLSNPVLLYSAVAYFGAITLKIVFQYPTASRFIEAFGYATIPGGLYLGHQTSILEVGAAYLLARVAVSRRKFSIKDAEGYGMGLGFWENGVFVGILGLVSVFATYLSIQRSSLSQAAYASIVQAEPQLFYPVFQALPFVAFTLLERISSLLLHFSWGCLCVLAAVLRKRTYVVAAFPMGLIDTLVPFESNLTLPVFEAIVFVIALVCLSATLLTVRVRGK